MLYSLNLTQFKAYLFTLIFVVGNLFLPFAIHHLPPIFSGVNNGLVWLPIYFFTLIASYKFGVQVGLLTAILSPVFNSLLFGMPAFAILPAIVIKSTLLALAAAFFAHKARKVSLWAILLSIIAYQIIGTAIECIGVDFMTAITDFRVGFPGMILQLFGGYFVLKALMKI